MKSRVLICLLIAVIALPIGLSSLRLANDLKVDFYELDDEIMFTKLRRIYLLAYDIENYEKELLFNYKGEKCSLTFANNHLFLSPGTQIFLENIEDLCFIERNNYLFISYIREGKEYEKILGKAGFYSSSFFGDNVSDDRSDK